MTDLVRIATLELVRFLSTHLPNLSDDWWAKNVVDRVGVQQQRMVQERDFTRLEQLDLAALLRVPGKLVRVVRRCGGEKREPSIGHIETKECQFRNWYSIEQPPATWINFGQVV